MIGGRALEGPDRGGVGYVGSTIALACPDPGISAVILHRPGTGRREFVADREFREGDIAASPLVDRIFSEHPDIYAMIHCAALIVVSDSVLRPPATAPAKT
jgi:UDP-glucose 4-epimerase